MERSRSLAVCLVGFACLLMFACKTTDTPKQKDGSVTGSRTTAGPQAPPSARLVSQNTAAGHSRGVRPVSSARSRDLRVKPADRTEELSGAAAGREITLKRALVVGGLPVLFMGATGLIVTSLDGRRRRLTTSSSRTGR